MQSATLGTILYSTNGQNRFDQQIKTDQQTVQGCSRQVALEGQDLRCTHPAYHELKESIAITTT